MSATLANSAVAVSSPIPDYGAGRLLVLALDRDREDACAASGFQVSNRDDGLQNIPDDG
jgi:hypothetical protein